MTLKTMWRVDGDHRYAALTEDGEYDVVIVGGGITGLTAAYFLKREGKRVAVLTNRRIGDGETEHTSAHLAYHIDARLPDLINRFGENDARLVWQGGMTAIEAIEMIAEENGIECEFARVPGHLHGSLTRSDNSPDHLWQDFEAAQKLGFQAEFLERGPVADKPAIRYRDNALFHPEKYLRGLARAFHGNGCVIHEDTEVNEIQDDPPVVVANKVRLRCGYVVVATHVPLQGAVNTARAILFQTKLYPYSTYVVAAPMTGQRLEAGLYWDTSDPYFYTRTRSTPEGDYIILGGADHKTGQVKDTDERFSQVESMLHQVWPGLTVSHRWSGQVIETPDGLPYIGEIIPHQFCATGYSGNGLTFGTLAGLMAADAATGASNPWQKLFDPHRKVGVRSAGEYVAENADFPAHLVAGWLRSRKSGSVDSIKPGQGAVLTLDGKRVACFRSEKGELSKVSAVCTHMGCIVRFNEAEQTWDCPCHGSRFLTNGDVMSGPAEKPLEKVK